MNVPNDVPPKVIADLASRFAYCQTQYEQALSYEQIRDASKNLAMLIAGLCPESRERSLAFTKLEEVVFWSNASIARKTQSMG